MRLHVGQRARRFGPGPAKAPWGWRCSWQGWGSLEAPSAILFTWTGGEKGPGSEPVVADLCPLNRPALNTFDTLGLSAPLLKSITEMGFETPTDIQAQAIPLLLEGDRDFIGLAQTGTGKTAAFGLPLLDHLDPEWDHVQALVLGAHP